MNPIQRRVFAIAATIISITAVAGESAKSTDMHDRMQGANNAHSRMSDGPVSESVPTMPGQDAFGTVQEIVRILESDPATDWSKVDLEALRQHLIDMNDVTLRSSAAAKNIENGIEIVVTGEGRTVASIQRMVGAHAHEIDRMNGWSARSDSIANGSRLTVTSTDPKEVRHIRGLGFIGILVLGSHHQRHHLAIARGEPIHAH